MTQLMGDIFVLGALIGACFGMLVIEIVYSVRANQRDNKRKTYLLELKDNNNRALCQHFYDKLF